MPSNIEIKAVLHNWSAAEAVASRLSAQAPQIINQQDFFFCCNGARLKLRILSSDRGELIRYERSNSAEPRRSCYLIARTQDPKTLLEILSSTLKVTAVVKKRRTLYLIGQTRIHLDEVEGLGDFLEVEVVLRPEQSESEGKRIATELMAEFGLKREEFIGMAYVDCLARQAVR